MTDMKAWSREVMADPRRVAVPIMTHPGIELCGYTVRQAVTDGRIHAEAICKLNEAFPAAACTVIMDLTVEAEAFGSEISFPTSWDDWFPTGLRSRRCKSPRWRPGGCPST